MLLFEDYIIRKKALTVVLLLACSTIVTAQQAETLTLNNVLDIVRQYHPVALKADLKTDSAAAVRQASRGAFDPAVYVDNEQKTFTGTSYYYHTKGELKIPTWYGIELKTGFENNGGNRLLSEVTAGKSSFAGISMPLLKNLALDKRRAALQQSNLLIKQTEAERSNIYNDLLYEAGAAYWEWVRSYQVYITLTQLAEVNQRRYNLVKRSYAGGDRAAIDTVEALTQLQNFQFLQSEAFFTFQGAGLDLSNYLWLPGNQPYQLPPGVVPDSVWQTVNVTTFPVPSMEELLTAARSRHPKLQSLVFKRDILQVDRRLKTQNLLPTLNVNYNFLRKGYEPWKGIGQNFLENNYKYGFEFYIPLFLRQARGELSLANIKLKDNLLEQDQAALAIENKVKTYFTQVLTLQQQVQLFENALANYERLLSVEEIKFNIGESSLFLLNSRENKVMEARQKVIELRTKYFKAQVALQWAAGVLQ